MKNLIKKLFKDDWEIAYCIQGEYELTTGLQYTNVLDRKQTVNAIYEIYYSKLRNDYKLVLSGYKPKSHSAYLNAINELNNRKNNLKK